MSTYGQLWTTTSPQAMYYFKMLYCTLSVPHSGLPPPLANASPSYLVSVLVYTPRQWGHQLSLSVTASCGDTWRTDHWQKVRAGEEIPQQIGEFADCKRGNNEIIIEAKSSLWNAHNCACWGMGDILTCCQYHIAGNWRSLVLSHHNRRFSSLLYCT